MPDRAKRPCCGAKRSYLSKQNPYCDDCDRDTCGHHDLGEEYVGRTSLSDYQHENRVNDNFRKMDQYR